MLVCSTWMWGKSYTPKAVPKSWESGQSRYVTNPDGILGSDEVASMVRIAEQVYAISGVEVATVALQAIEGDAFDFSVELFNRWGIGDRERNRGVLILFVLDSHDIRITTGGGVEGVLPDARCREILDDEVIPTLRTGSYGKGLVSANRAIARILTTDEAQAELLLGYRPKPITEMPWNILAALSLLFSILLPSIYRVMPRCPKCGTRNVDTRRTIVRAPTYDIEGISRTIYTCRDCGHTWHRDTTLARKQRHDGPGVIILPGGGRSGGYGGGFSGGFGGGSTFGGGAGGKW